MKKQIFMNTKNEALELMLEINQYLEQWDWDGEEEIDLEEKYSQRVKEVGQFNLIVCLFQNYSDATLMSLMSHFFFVWKDFNYHDWKKILYVFANNSIILYQVIWVFGDVLAIDIGQVIQEDKQVSDQARNYLKMHFPKGTPKAGYPLYSFEENNIEPATLWKRFKEQGAPMNVDV